MSNQQLTGTFTLSIQGEGPAEVPVTTLREALESRNIALDTPVMQNGLPVTLDAAIADGDVVTVAKPGEGA